VDERTVEGEVLMTTFDIVFTLINCHKWILVEECTVEGEVLMTTFDIVFTLINCHRWILVDERTVEGDVFPHSSSLSTVNRVKKF
jgi:hypothetical protein